ncbi:hypothetical protein RhiLY_00145 [Ceratobasidium sp. AG-Ba]|nr:hypothetical protein RhiLY_00145 [Ceratobasidium sp. AG-Ba]
MSQPAARTYEDVLQCIIPALEGLLPVSIETHILTLLYVLAEWHGLAKLRRHTSASVDALRHTTTRLGHELREFHRYTSEMEVYETPKERTARQRARKRARPRAALANNSDAYDSAPVQENERRRRFFNLDTIKMHSLPDYTDSIETMGTTDSTSTQTGELIHRFSKIDMNAQTRIEERLKCIQSNLGETTPARTHQAPPATPLFSDASNEPLPSADSGRLPYQIAQSQKNVIVLPLWVQKYRQDPATKDFLPRLKAHLYTRFTGGQYQDELKRSSQELSTIRFQHDRLYTHCTLRVHYTTYDVRRAQDTVNPRTPKRFVILPSHEALDPRMGARRFWYAKVLGVYHANVSYKGALPKRVDFLWVRWLARMTDVPGGGGTCRLDQLGYFKDSDEFHAFDFVDPADVIRGAHLIPRFVGEHTTEYLNHVESLAIDSEVAGDWKHYYLNRFADRDMLMRFTGMAIGHMTLSCMPDETVAPPKDVSQSTYDYTDADSDAGGGLETDEADIYDHAQEYQGKTGNNSNEEEEDDDNDDMDEDFDEYNEDTENNCDDGLDVDDEERAFVEDDDVSW